MSEPETKTDAAADGAPVSPGALGLSFHMEHIECPECEEIQRAKVEHTEPFWTYIQRCVFCGYVIMESDWNAIPER